MISIFYNSIPFIPTNYMNNDGKFQELSSMTFSQLPLPFFYALRYFPFPSLMKVLFIYINPITPSTTATTPVIGFNPPAAAPGVPVAVAAKELRL